MCSPGWCSAIQNHVVAKRLAKGGRVINEIQAKEESPFNEGNHHHTSN